MKVSAQSGFTIIEIMIYVALVTVAMVVLANFTADVIKNAARTRVVKEVELNAQLTLSRLASEVRHAKSITSISATELTLVDANNTSVILRFDSTDNEVERVVGTNTESITTPDVRVTGLVFSQVREGVAIQISVAQHSINVPAAYQHQSNLSTTVFPRQLLY